VNERQLKYGRKGTGSSTKGDGQRPVMKIPVDHSVARKSKTKKAYER